MAADARPQRYWAMLHVPSPSRISAMKDLFRTLLSIRQKRRPPPVGPLPPVGATIIRGQVKMAITHPIPRELWDWLVLSGWRNLPVKNDRRQGLTVPEGALQELIEADPQERNRAHARILEQAQALPPG